MIKDLHHDGSSWMWRNANGKSLGLYYTSNSGEGIFFQEDETGNIKQVTGLGQFQACETASGMRRKLNRMIFDDWYFDRTYFNGVWNWNRG